LDIGSNNEKKKNFHSQKHPGAKPHKKWTTEHILKRETLCTQELGFVTWEVSRAWQAMNPQGKAARLPERCEEGRALFWEWGVGGTREGKGGNKGSWGGVGGEEG
jgi:hypothetical protein